MVRKLHFTKMHGLGNDYVYFNALGGLEFDPSALAPRLSDRHFGIGGDGIVMILPSAIADFRMRMFNADGSEAQMCGNAIRCVAKYLYDRGHTTATSLLIETGAGVKNLTLTVEQSAVSWVDVDMGEPILLPSLIPVRHGGERVIDTPIPDLEEALTMTCVSMGNPHAVVFVTEITDRLVHEIGPKIERHPIFPERTNVEFVRVIAPDEVEMRVWERGSGETLACGTGATAVCVAGVLTGRTQRKITVHLRGGELVIEWRPDNHCIMRGPAATVFDGVIEL